MGVFGRLCRLLFCTCVSLGIAAVAAAQPAPAVSAAPARIAIDETLDVPSAVLTERRPASAVPLAARITVKHYQLSEAATLAALDARIGALARNRVAIWLVVEGVPPPAEGLGAWT